MKRVPAYFGFWDRHSDNITDKIQLKFQFFSPKHVFQGHVFLFVCLLFFLYRKKELRWKTKS